MCSIDSKLYTYFAFASLTSMVLSTMYRKWQTRISCNESFWDEFWKYIMDQNKHKSSINIKTYQFLLTRISMIRPSDSINNHITVMIDRYYQNIYNKLGLSDTNASQTNHINMHCRQLSEYLQKHPFKILVPLCGCSYDLLHISLLLQRKYKLHSSLYQIIGIDSSLPAVRNFFQLNEIVFKSSCYNPKYMRNPMFYRVRIYSNKQYSINIIQYDIFKYFDLITNLKRIGIGRTPCLIEQKCIDIIVDVNSMSCINPSDRNMYIKLMKYWLSDDGCMLLNTYCYDQKKSNYPPFTIHPEQINKYFDKCMVELLESKQCRNDIQLKINSKRLTFGERSKMCSNKIAKKMFKIMEDKQTNLCCSADVNTCEKVLKLAENVGPYICLLKTHVDIIIDFNNEFINKLQIIANKYNFLIFADISNTVKSQFGQGIYKISSWTHITNAHSIPGPGIINGLKQVSKGDIDDIKDNNNNNDVNHGLLLLAEMSSKGNLATNEYTKTT
eukprot:450455_1